MGFNSISDASIILRYAQKSAGDALVRRYWNKRHVTSGGDLIEALEASDIIMRPEEAVIPPGSRAHLIASFRFEPKPVIVGGLYVVGDRRNLMTMDPCAELLFCDGLPLLRWRGELSLTTISEKALLALYGAYVDCGATRYADNLHAVAQMERMARRMEKDGKIYEPSADDIARFRLGNAVRQGQDELRHFVTETAVMAKVHPVALVASMMAGVESEAA